VKNIAVFASGNGSNFQAIADAIKRDALKVNLKLLVCDNPRAYVLERARKAGIKTVIIERQVTCHPDASVGAGPPDFSRSRQVTPTLRSGQAGHKEFEEKIIKILKAEKIDLIVLAGFMRILSSDFIRQYKFKILNIHPALLPAFKGAHAIKDAFAYGVKVTGVTVHFVDGELDHGPIILQEVLKISKRDTLKSLEKKIHKVEHKIYPKAIRLFISGKLKIEGRKVKVEVKGK
jgi:phosphoribosylglycinamide formyltransferase-1